MRPDAQTGSVGSFRISKVSDEGAVAFPATLQHVRYISDNPFRLLAVSSATIHTELRRKAKQAVQNAAVGLAAKVPLSDCFGSDDLERCADIVHSVAADAVERTAYRLLWPLDYEQDIRAKVALSKIGLSASHVGETDPMSAAHLHLEFVRTWCRFQLRCDPDSLEQSLQHFAEIYESGGIDQALADALTAEGERESLDLVYEGESRVIRYLLETACQRAAQSFTEGDTDKATEIATVVIESRFTDDDIDQALVSALEPVGNRVATRLRTATNGIDSWSPEVDPLCLLDGTANLKELASVLKGHISSASQWLELVEKRVAQVAYSMREYAIDLANKESDYDGASTVLTQACTLPLSDSLLSELEDDLNELQELRDMREPRSAIYEVRIFGSSVRVPPMCVCCFGSADQEHRATREWTENTGSTNTTRSISLEFPICTACAKHREEFGNKGFFLVAATCLISGAFSYLLGGTMAHYELAWSILLGLSLTTFFGLIFNRVFRLVQLGDEHASRGDAVWIASAHLQMIYFRFRHSAYAHAFAEANNSKVDKVSCSRPSRGRSLLLGSTAPKLVLWLVILTLATSIMIHGEFNGWYGSSGYSRVPDAPVPLAPGEREDEDVDEAWSARRDRLVAERDSLISALDEDREALDASGSEIDSTKQELEARSESIEQDRQFLNRYSEDAVAEFNEKVHSFNRDGERLDERVRDHNNRLKAARKQAERLEQVERALQEMGGY